MASPVWEGPARCDLVVWWGMSSTVADIRRTLHTEQASRTSCADSPADAQLEHNHARPVQFKQRGRFM